MSSFVMVYNKYSRGGRAVARGLGVKSLTKTDTSIRLSGSNPPTPNQHLVVNWGCTSGTAIINALARVVNPTSKVSICSNKLKFFKAVADSVRVPEFTDDLDTALEWGEAGHEVLGRDTNGSCGTDIVFYSEDLVNFATKKFWVKYKKKKEEYRVHVMDDKVLFVQKKVLRTSDPVTNEPIPADDVDFRIRNHRNGFIFQRHNFEPPQDVIEQALRAVKAAGLDFGAVDCIYNQYEGKAYVLEINTAPGLEGTSVDDYIAGLRALVKSRNWANVSL